MSTFHKSIVSLVAVKPAKIVVIVFLIAIVGAQSQTSEGSPQNDPSLRPKIASNLVVVRVVVRDKHGKPVENLTKDDFRLFDRGKEQLISQFEATNGIQPSSDGVRAPEKPTPVPSTSSSKSIAFYFDDLNIPDADLIYARDAADQYLTANTQAQDEVAIFTSEQMLTNFTSNPQQIHDALLKLHTSERALSEHHCPDLSDYQALRITENDERALDAAIDDASHCDMGILEKSPRDFLVSLIRKMAQNVVNQAQIQTRTNLQQLAQAVTSVSQRSGQRTLVLVSQGFLSEYEHHRVDGLVNQALHSQVVINALDVKGLAVLMRTADSSRSYIPAVRPDRLQEMRTLESERERAATSILENLTDSTGGLFFTSSNDLGAGFATLAGSTPSYILAFVPEDIKPDGKFHPLKVVLAKKKKDLKVQARRGYFAPGGEEDFPYLVSN